MNATRMILSDVIRSYKKHAVQLVDFDYDTIDLVLLSSNDDDSLTFTDCKGNLMEYPKKSYGENWVCYCLENPLKED